MAEEPQKPGPAEAVAASTEEVVVVVPDAPPPEKSIAEREPPASEPEPEAAEKSAPVEEVVEEAEKPKAEEDVKITQSESFKEESYVVSELPESQKKAFDEFKQLVQEALNKHEFTAPPPPPPAPAKEEEKKEEKEEEKEKEKEEEEKAPASSSAAAAAEEEPSKVEPKTVEAKEEAEPPKVETKEEEVVVVEKATAEVESETVKEEEKVPPPPSAESSVTVIVTEVVEKVTAVDEDGAKTVEAIEETIVAVSAPPEEPASAKETEAAPAEPKEEAEAVPPPPPEEVFIWGIPLLGDERSDVILLKFLRARDFKVKEAFAMLKNTVRWRKEFEIDALLEEDHGNDWEKVVFTHGVDKDGHPVCYNVYSEFENKELYQNTFSSEEKRQKFLRWRIQFLEKSIRKLDFSPTGISTIVQVNDFKNLFGFGKWDLWQATKQAVQLLQDNYPEFLAKQVFINVPWWYLAYNRILSPFLTQRTKSKFVFAGPSKSAETLFKYVAPEQVPVQYGGLKREGEQEFITTDPVTDAIIKPAAKHTIEFPVSEASLLVWEVRVVGWDVSYGAEFVPSAEGGYTVIVQKTRKITTADETVISNSFKIGEPGKVVLTFDNQTSRKKKLLYRSKTKPSLD